MSTFKTIHVFGFGDVQVIGPDKKGTVKSNTLTKLTAFVNHVKSLRPTDVLDVNYHVIHIFNGTTVRYLGIPAVQGDKVSFSIAFEDINTTILNELVAELEAAV